MQFYVAFNVWNSNDLTFQWNARIFLPKDQIWTFIMESNGSKKYLILGCWVWQVSPSTLLAYSPVSFLLSIQNPRVEFRQIILQSFRKLYPWNHSSLIIAYLNSEWTKPQSTSRAHLCPLKALLSLSISEYRSSWRWIRIFVFSAAACLCSWWRWW